MKQMKEEKSDAKQTYEESHESMGEEFKAAKKKYEGKTREIEELKKKVKELEQAERIIGFKTKDVKRQMRHNHLKPITRALTPTEAARSSR